MCCGLNAISAAVNRVAAVDYSLAAAATVQSRPTRSAVLGDVDDVANPKNGSADWQILDRRLVADRSPFVRMFDVEVRLPDGSTVSDFVRVEIRPYAMVFALLKDGRVPMVRQYRLAVEGFMLELPAGLIESDEESLVAAKRELREEAGVEAPNWQFLGKYVMDANKQCGWGYMYLALDAEQVAAPDHGDLGEMTLHLHDLSDIRRMMAAGELISGPTALCMGLALNKLGG